MPDLPDPGHPYDDFPSDTMEEKGKVRLLHVVLGFLFVPACFMLTGYMPGRLMPFAPGLPFLLIGGATVFAVKVLKWRGFLQGVLLAAGLAGLLFLLVIGYCMMYPIKF